MGSIRRLLTPLSYLRIEREDKVKDELIIPLALTSLSIAALILLSGKIPVFSEKGMLSFIVNYLQIVSGFYIASLAAVATFNKDSMDRPMPGLPTTLPRTMKGVEVIENLSRRRFLCFLFGYLSLLSLILYFSGSGLILAAPHIKTLISANVAAYLKWTVVFFYLMITYNLLVTTLLGLYYMTDKIHRADTVQLQAPKSEQQELSNLSLEDDLDY
jgi:hypothetical protein